MEGARRHDVDSLPEDVMREAVHVDLPREEADTKVGFDSPDIVDPESRPDKVEPDREDRREAIAKFLKDSEAEMIRTWNHYQRFERISHDAGRPPEESEAARVTAEDFLRLFKRQKVLWEVMKEAEDKL